LLDQEEFIRVKDVAMKQIMSERDCLHGEIRKLDASLKEMH
jgi:hypothetical protein